MYSSHSIVRVTCLRLSSRCISAQSGSTRRRWPCLVPAAANSAVSSALSVISAGNGQLNPAVASRFNVNRTVDGAPPTRRAISLSPTPAVLKRSTSRTWRIVVLSAGIRSPHAKAKGADPNRASRGAAYPGEIIPEWRAKSSWNAERDQIGMVGDIIADSRATSPGIRSLNNAGGLLVLFHLDRRLLGVPPRPVGVLFRWKIGFKDRLQHQRRRRHADPIPRA